MDAALVALGFLVPLLVALCWAVWYLVARCQRERRRQERWRWRSHRFRGQGEAVTVAELLENALEDGTGIRLNWATGHGDGHREPAGDDTFPTVVLPKLDSTPGLEK